MIKFYMALQGGLVKPSRFHSMQLNENAGEVPLSHVRLTFNKWNCIQNDPGYVIS